jgi:hypothetical protein
MAVPASGNPLVMGKIYQELDGAGYSTASDPGEIVSLSGLVGGQPDTINSNSASKPNTSTPHSMSEWYSYDHSATAPFTWGTSQGIGANMFDVNMSTDNGSRGQSGTVIKISHSSGQVNYQVVDIIKNSPQSGSFYGNGADSTRSVSYTGTLSALYIQFIFTSIDIDEEHESAPGQLAAEIRKHTTAHVSHPDYTGYSFVQTLSAGTNQNITGTITQIGHTGSSSYFVMLETGSTGPGDRDQIIMHNGTVACKLYANSTTGSSVTLFTGDVVDIEAGSSDDSS